jgi:hypothetical protein
MSQLDFVADPGLKAQAITDTGIMYMVILGGFTKETKKKFIARAQKIRSIRDALDRPQRIQFVYDLDGSFDDVGQAQQACQDDYDRFGDEVPSPKLSHPLMHVMEEPLEQP